MGMEGDEEGVEGGEGKRFGIKFGKGVGGRVEGVWGGIGGLVERGGEEVYVRVVGIVLYLGFLFDIGIFFGLEDY